MRDSERMGQGMMGSDFYNSSRSGHESNWDQDNSFTFGRRGTTYNDPSRGFHTGDRDRYGDRYQRSHASSNAWDSPDNYRSRYLSGHDRDWADKAGDEVKSWFGDDDAERRRNRDDRWDNDRVSNRFGNDRDQNDSRFGRQSYQPTTRDHYNNSRTIDSGQYDTHRYNTSNDNYTGYGANYDGGSSWLGSDNDRDRARSGSYASGNRYDRDSSWNRDRDENDRGFLNRAGDEVRSWFGDEEAERRRRLDDVRDYAEDRHRNYDRDNSYRSNSYGNRRQDDNWW